MTSSTAKEPSANTGPGIEIFRFASSPSLFETSHMEVADMTPELQAGIGKAVEAGFNDGNIVRTLFSQPGFSLSYAWFKSGFPLPPHTHNADCLYYIVAGELSLGTEKLGPGDGFFVGAGKVYSYRPGPEGVEVLEFRTQEDFDIKFLPKTVPAWEKISEMLLQRKEHWDKENAPSGLL